VIRGSAFEPIFDRFGDFGGFLPDTEGGERSFRSRGRKENTARGVCSLANLWGVFPMPRFRITITSKDREAMLDLVRKHKIQIFDHGGRYSDSAGYSVDAVAEPPDIQKLQQAGYRVEQHEDVDETGKARQQEVGRGNRYERPGPR
jgi:hypothetical protein